MPHLLALPPDLLLDIITSLDSYDTLISLLQAHPHFRLLTSSFPLTIFTAIASTEAGNNTKRPGGHSMLLHSISLLSLSHLLSTTPKPSPTQDLLFFSTLNSLRGCPISEELSFWLRFLLQDQTITLPETSTQGTIQQRAMSRILTTLISNHTHVQTLFSAYIVDVLPKITQSRCASMRLTYYAEIDDQTELTNKEREEMRQLEADIHAASAKDVSEAERYRIMTAIYGLWSNVELVRFWNLTIGQEHKWEDVTGRYYEGLMLDDTDDEDDAGNEDDTFGEDEMGDSEDDEDYEPEHTENVGVNPMLIPVPSKVSVERLQEVVWLAYDTIWQLEGITAIYKYLREKTMGAASVRESVRRQAGMKMVSDLITMVQNDTDECTGNIEEEYLDLSFATILLQEGIGGVLKSPDCIQRYLTHTELELTYYSKLQAKDGDKACCQWALMQPYQNLLVYGSIYEQLRYSLVMRFVLNPTVTKFGDRQLGSALPFASWAYRFNLEAVKRRAREIYGLGDEKECLRLYCPPLRIADEDWLGFERPEIRAFWWANAAYFYGDTADLDPEELGVLVDLAFWDEQRLIGWQLEMPEGRQIY